MKRTVELFIGDWSRDGHEKADKIVVNIEGLDVTDEALQTSHQKSKQALLVDIFDLFSNYEENQLSAEIYDRFVRAGFKPSEDRGIRYYVWTDSGEVCGLELLMWFIGRNIEQFRWEEVQVVYPCLVGGYNTIIKQEDDWSGSSYGYGFFY